LEFHIVYHALNNFCSVDLSALYLDIVKDRLYCEGASSQTRRSAQTTLYRILEVLVHLMAPILSFTAEEIWDYMPSEEDRPESVFLAQIPLPDEEFTDEELGDRWEKIFRLRGEILKGLEAARNNSVIGHSLDAKVVLYPEKYLSDSSFKTLLRGYERCWPEILIVSQVELRDGEPRAPMPGPMDSGEDHNQGISYSSSLLGGPIHVIKADGEKCQRCWNYSLSVGKDPSHLTVCARCSEVLRSGVPS
jgi:isoleucyl-tRNA synthetase